MIQVQSIELNAESASQQVRTFLPSHEVGGVTLAVVEENVYLQQGYWHVPVRPNTDPCCLTELLDMLAEIETTLQLDYDLKIIVDLSDPRFEEGSASGD